MKREIDFSKGKRNKFAGKKLIIIGDPRVSGRIVTNGKLTRLYRVILPERGDVIEIEAPNKQSVRLKILHRFNKTRLPKGTVIERAF